jgi:hypothetical protein
MADEPVAGLPLLKNLWAKEAAANTVRRPLCNCLDAQYEDDFEETQQKKEWRELSLHTDIQDTQCDAWEHLCALIDEAAADGREEFSPGREMLPQQWAQITALPPSIAKLKAVKHFILYGSSLVRIPPEIGEMTSLEEFTPYTSYRLHWFPFEITRCKNLKRSTVSTRALYGNYKYRPPFPRLPQISSLNAPGRCSVCATPLPAQGMKQVWISLPVATDVLPLLVHACSDQCIGRLPTPPKSYVQAPHAGGLGLAQPEPR